MKTTLRTLGILMIGLILSACASQQYYQTALQSWHGNQIQPLISVWGPPNSSYIGPNGNTYYIYTAQQVVTTPDSTFYGLGGAADVSVYNCTTWFEVDKNNRIINTYSRGNHCVATENQAQALGNQ